MRNVAAHITLYAAEVSRKVWVWQEIKALKVIRVHPLRSGKAGFTLKVLSEIDNVR